MNGGDFRSNEQSLTIPNATTARIEHVADDGTVTVLKDGLALQAGEVVDGTMMSKKALLAFLSEQVEDAKTGVLFSLHMKATMMKVSRPHHLRACSSCVLQRTCLPNMGTPSTLSAWT